MARVGRWTVPTHHQLKQRIPSSTVGKALFVSCTVLSIIRIDHVYFDASTVVCIIIAQHRVLQLYNGEIQVPSLCLVLISLVKNYTIDCAIF